jgi:glycosyltransferase involved in cell wall biosynthesis
VAATGEQAICIPNGLDLSFYTQQNNFGSRPFPSVLFIYNPLALKGSRYAVDAVVQLKKKYPDLTAIAFGTGPRPDGFPGIINYHHNPSQKTIRRLYNLSSVYIASSLSEGWDLPLCEAILCGCACVATDIPGHREYIQDGVNGFFCKPASSQSIIETVEYIFKNKELAGRMSETAFRTLQKYDWDSRVKLFEEAIAP